ncbi:MAG: hypothetical protein IKA48_09585 [Fibrobacter sp.]|nr:hypothetical protein [Fibrobacter sp.]
MKSRFVTFLVMIAAGVSLAQLLPQKQAEDLPKIDRAMIFKVDYSDEVEMPADTSRTIEQPVRSAEKSELANNTLFINTLCATGAVLGAVLGGNGTAGCFVIPSSKLKF